MHPWSTFRNKQVGEDKNQRKCLVNEKGMPGLGSVVFVPQDRHGYDHLSIQKGHRRGQCNP